MLNSEKTRAKIAKRLRNFIVSDSELSELQVDGHAPLAIVEPNDAEQICELVKLCADGSVILATCGAGYQVYEANRDPEQQRPVILVSTAKLKNYLGYSHEDLTITVETGVTMAELAELTSTFGQHLPIDAPQSETATVGGLVATNAHGPRSMKHGPTGDYVLGGAMVMADGNLIKSGAKTVKSVAGYDLHKLLVGSYGSLGIVTEVTFKLRPMPDDFRMAQIVVESASDAAYQIGQLVRDKTRPSMIELFNSFAADDLGHELAPEQMLICVAYEDITESVEWQLTQLHVSLGDDNIIILNTEDSLAEYQQIAQWPAEQCDFSFEAIVLGRKCETLVEYCNQEGLPAIAHSGSGVVIGRGTGSITLEMAESLLHAAGPGSGLKFTKLPPGCDVPRWLGQNSSHKWMRAVKEQFDPNAVFPWPGFLNEPDEP